MEICLRINLTIISKSTIFESTEKSSKVNLDYKYILSKFIYSSCCCCGKKRKRSVNGTEIGQGSLSRRRRALHDLERWNYMQNTKQNIRSALLELI
ncbi:Uncharacterized protein BM_BM269 [Brugia malayi]|uniref:Bm269 n=1 Tax=Brugia malayi TaxID=6279 RepID=A0A4E9EYS3_BRUMA|nr:Uncharacterized protein BM_BM269 [Brugia malayi]VIO89445.1 Uncharacterized protein BM_BM269 [Brugia malayi]